MGNFRYLWAAASLLAITACENKSGTSVEGDITQPEGITEVHISRLHPQKQEILDTVAVTDGKFSLNLEVDTADFYVVGTNDNYNIPLYIQPGENVEITVEGSEEDRTYEVDGSPLSTRIRRINQVTIDARKRIDSLNEYASLYQDSANFGEMRVELNTTFEKIVDDARTKMKKMIDEDPGNITNLFIFPAGIGNFQLISPEGEMDYYEKVAENLEKDNPNSRHAKFFLDRMEQMREQVALNKKLEETRKNIAPGKPIPEIEMTGPDGEIHKLSDLRGKIVLVDFWAAWCRPCRFENPNLVRTYNQYKDQGFDVFSVSLDGLPQQQNPKQAWVQAIEQDGLVWENHVSELQGWNTSVVRQFGFNGIPFTILVDKDGTILATDLRGPVLEAKLKEVLAKS